jgi:uncharacterized protein YbdZ (MbtH family)
MTLLLIEFSILAGKADKDIPAGKTWMKKHGIRWDCGDYITAMQWYELEGDNGLGDDQSEGQPMVDIFNSSELRLAGFSMTQLSGERLLDARAV